MKRILFGSIAMVALLASCSSDGELVQSGEKFDGKVTLSAPAYEYEDGTRTALTSSESGIGFAWDDDETIGIFPIAPTTNAQAYQKLNGGSDDATKSSFDGAGWALLRGNTYAAYYPFQTTETLDYTKVPVDMTGQTQNGNGSLAHIGAGYDYMYATASVPKSGDVNFDFNHAASIVKLELTMPVAATWSSVTLSSDNEVFITKATMDVSTGVVTSVSKASSVVLNLSNVSTSSADQKLDFYLAVLPTTTGTLTVIAQTATNKEYTATLSSKTLKAGVAHLWTATLAVPQLSTGNGVENGHEYVDLGLPSRLKWATMNLGASIPDDYYGSYYAWGETKAYEEEDETNLTNYNYFSQRTYVKTYYEWDTYKWCDGTSTFMTKYCVSSSYGTVDNKTNLDASDDAACVNWGGKWRMPTLSEQEELMNNCTWEWVTSYNNVKVKGYVITGSNGNSIFLPAAGYRNSSSRSYSGARGYYWSSSLSEDYNDAACVLYFIINDGYYNDTRNRYVGQSVRAVCEK